MLAILLPIQGTGKPLENGPSPSAYVPMKEKQKKLQAPVFKLPASVFMTIWGVNQVEDLSPALFHTLPFKQTNKHIFQMVRTL